MPDNFLTPPRGHDALRRSSSQEARILRERIAAHQAAMDTAAASEAPFTAARMLVQVFNGGSMPSDPEKVYFTHPVLATGAETEGVAATLTVDAATTVPVIVLWHAPAVDDYLTAYAVSGRWVSEISKSGGGITPTPCSPCNIPNEDLTVTWTNVLAGNGSATMVYDPSGGPLWSTGCEDDGLIFSLGCNAGSLEFRVTFFIAGACPTGESQFCSSLGVDPLALTLTESTCTPFSLTFAVTDTNCPGVNSNGNTQFTVML